MVDFIDIVVEGPLVLDLSHKQQGWKNGFHPVLTMFECHLTFSAEKTDPELPIKWCKFL
jgi:hypothetical protein